jgi:adenosylmethionine-8-amino-7-oxononanoate aminotransferase
MRLAALEEACEFVGSVRGLGLLYGFDFIRDRTSGEPFPASVPFATAVQQAARKRGLLMRASPQIGTLAPPLVTTIEEIDEIADILDDAVEDVTAKLRTSAGLDVEVGFGL